MPSARAWTRAGSARSWRPRRRSRRAAACDWCRTARPMLCRERLSIGSGVDGGFAAAVVVPAAKLHRLPDWLDDHAAALLEPLACGCNSLFDPAVIEAGDRVLVTGPGPVGLLAAQLARIAGRPGRRRAARPATGSAWRSRRGSASRPLASTTPATAAALDAEAAERAIDVVVEALGGAAGRAHGADLAAAARHARPDGPAVGRRSASRSARSSPASSGSAPASAAHRHRGCGPCASSRRRSVELAPLVSDVLPLRDWPRALDGVRAPRRAEDGVRPAARLTRPPGGPASRRGAGPSPRRARSPAPPPPRGHELAALAQPEAGAPRLEPLVVDAVGAGLGRLRPDGQDHQRLVAVVAQAVEDAVGDEHDRAGHEPVASRSRCPRSGRRRGPPATRPLTT